MNPDAETLELVDPEFEAVSFTAVSTCMPGGRGSCKYLAIPVCLESLQCSNCVCPAAWARRNAPA